MITAPGVLQALALDVDGTLLTDDHDLAPSTVRAVADARAAGVEVILVSARYPAALTTITLRLGIDTGYFIGCQGAIVARLTGPATYDVLAETRIDAVTASTVEAAAARAGFSASRFTADRWTVTHVDDTIRREAAVLGIEPDLADAASAGDDPHKLMVACAPDADTGELTRFANSLPVQLTWTLSHPFMLEVTAAGVDKASALDQLLSHLGLDPVRVAAIGDGSNDVGMFGLVGTAVAMGNAPPAVRAAASWTTRTNSADGVALAIERLLTARHPHH